MFMIKPLIEKINKFIISEEYYAALRAAAHRRGLDEDQTDMLGLVIGSLLHGEIDEKDFAWHIADRCDIELAAGDILARDLHAAVLAPLRKELATEFGYSALVEEKPAPVPVAKPAEQPVPVAQPAAPKPVVGADKLRPIVSPTHPHIENPPRKFITDPSHLIDDTIDERPKLQDHYTD